MTIIKFFNRQKKNPCNLVPMILQTKVCVADISFLGTHFLSCIYFLVSVADCGNVQLFCSYFSKNEAVKLSFTLFMFYYNII